MKEHNGIDPAVLAGYEAGREFGRLRRGLGLVECARTREILLEALPAAPAVVYDVGGGYGEYAWWLASLGHRVALFDLAGENIRLAGELAAEYPGVALEGMEVADARTIHRPGGSADTVLLMGPLYHIVEREERGRALKEAARLLKPGGKLFAAAITRWSTALWAASAYGRENDLLGEAAFGRMLRREWATGHHIHEAGSAYRGLGRSYFHRPEELREELAAAGFEGAALHGVVGPGWLVPCLDEAWADPHRREAVLGLVRELGEEEALLGLSTHLLAVAEKR